MYEVKLTKKILKQLKKLDVELQEQYIKLFKSLKLQPFLGKLSETIYHTHVKYSWVAVWEVDKGKQIVIITFVGSREDAPYGR